MNTTGKIAIGVSFASSVVLAAWLLTGDRKMKTKHLVSKSIRSALKTEKMNSSEFDHYYI